MFSPLGSLPVESQETYHTAESQKLNFDNGTRGIPRRLENNEKRSLCVFLKNVIMYVHVWIRGRLARGRKLRVSLVGLAYGRASGRTDCCTGGCIDYLLARLSLPRRASVPLAPPRPQLNTSIRRFSSTRSAKYIHGSRTMRYPITVLIHRYTRVLFTSSRLPSHVVHESDTKPKLRNRFPLHVSYYTFIPWVYSS